MGQCFKMCCSAHTQIGWIVAVRESDKSIGTNFAKTTTTRSIVQIVDSLGSDGTKLRKSCLGWDWNGHLVSFDQSPIEWFRVANSLAKCTYVTSTILNRPM